MTYSILIAYIQHLKNPPTNIFENNIKKNSISFDHLLSYTVLMNKCKRYKQLFCKVSVSGT